MPNDISGQGSQLPTAALSKFWDQYKPHIIGGLAGAGIGAAGLGGAAALSGEEDPEVKSRNVKRNLLLGAALGGVGGAGVGSGYKMQSQETPDGPLSKAWDFATGSRAAQGGLAATAINQGLRRVANQGLGFGGKGGAWQGKTIDQLGEMLDAQVKNFGNAMPFTPGADPSLRAQAEKGMRDVLDRMTANRGTLGRLSQHPIFRRLGINVVSPDAEFRALQGLRPLSQSPEGIEALKRILGGGRGHTGRAMPLLQKGVLGGIKGEEALRASQRGSALGRIGTGAGLASGIGGLVNLLGD